MQVFFANVDYTLHLNYEKYYQTIFFVIFELLKFKVEAEVTTNKGRIDVVVETERFIYLFEFKLSGTKEEALQQIKDKQYYQKYLHCGKEIRLIGVAFDQKHGPNSCTVCKKAACLAGRKQTGIKRAVKKRCAHVGFLAIWSNTEANPSGSAKKGECPVANS